MFDAASQVFIEFSILIIVFNPNRASNYLCFKIKQPKPKVHSPIDEKTKNFSIFQKTEWATKRFSLCLVTYIISLMVAFKT
jgi:hypothetical protein